MSESNMTKIKICGITNYQDASWCMTLGADFLGFNFYKKSPRKISVHGCSEILTKMPKTFIPVGIFVDEEIGNIVDIIGKTGIGMVQLHGRESPEFCKELRGRMSPDKKIIKGFRIKNEGTLKYVARYRDAVDYFLLDTWTPSEPGGTGPGGTGETFNWDVAVSAKRYEKPIFLAGGLTPENINQAIEKVQPYAVDVASGVERLPRRKDYEKLKLFILKARPA